MRALVQNFVLMLIHLDPLERLRVTVTNVDEAGEVTLTTLQPQEGVEITATLTDPDGRTT